MHARRRLGFPRRVPPVAAVAASNTKPPPLLPATIRAAGSPPAIPPAATSRRSTCPSRIRAAWTNPRRSSLEARPAVGEPRSTSPFVARLQTRPRELLHIAMASSSMNPSNDESDDDLDMYCLLAACMAEEGEKVPYAARRVPLITGIQWVEERMKDPKRFYKCFRMRRSVFTMLHDTLVADYGLMSTSQMSSKESLALFLWMLGAPESNSQAADRFERSVSTVSNKFHHVLDCVDRMAGDYIVPNDPTFVEPHASLRNHRFWPHFKDAIGAIDGTHIPVIVAEKDKIKYTNRKGYTSQNVLAICDFDLRFTFVVPGWPGSVHDTRVCSATLLQLSTPSSWKILSS